MIYRYPPDRLKALKDYLTAESGRLTAAGIAGAGNRSTTLRVLKDHLTAQKNQAEVHAAALLAKGATLRAEIARQDGQEAVRLAARDRELAEAALATQRGKAVAVVEAARPRVLEAAHQLRTRDPKMITSLLAKELAEMVRAPKAGEPGADDARLTLALVERFTVAQQPCPASGGVEPCTVRTSIDVVDNLIASLRAQRVRAVANGDTAAAENLLKAINAAYDQRTAMIYLRPASDYLRSVYSSTSLQDGTEHEYRNMLTDWFKKYLNPLENDKQNLGRKQLEKIHWQNVNKVTVSGGGFTNYVLAKDDVGNWYVKAYGSDPEAIIKSATSLALFNTGKAVNTNLLRRFEVQRQLDEDSGLSAERRAELRRELDLPDRIGGEALLKVRDRYAARYAKETATQAAALLGVVNGLPAQAAAEIRKVPDWPESTCPLADAVKLLEPLDARFLDAGRKRLEKAIADAGPNPAAGAALEEMERSIHAVLTGMHLYGSDVPRILKTGKDAGCESAERIAAERVRSYARAQVALAATDRRASIERYEDALDNVVQIAGAK